MIKGSRVETMTWRSLSNYHHGQNRLDLGKLIRVMRNKTNKTISPHPSLILRFSFTPDILPLSSTGERGMGIAVSSSHVVSVDPSFSHSSPAPV